MKKPRKKILINPELQYRHALTSALILVVAINLFILAGTFFPIETGLYVNFSLFQYLCVGLLELVCVLIVWYLSIRASHKMAGPAIAFGRELEKLATGDLTIRINLRSGDAFQETAERINVGVTNLRLRVESIKRIADQLEHCEEANLAEQIKHLNAELGKITTAT